MSNFASPNFWLGIRSTILPCMLAVSLTLPVPVYSADELVPAASEPANTANTTSSNNSSSSSGAVLEAGAQQVRLVPLIRENGPKLLTFQQLNSLALDPSSVPGLKPQVDQLLQTPFFFPNAALMQGKVSSGANKHTAFGEAQMPTLRAASWNIERGFQLPKIISVFTMKKIPLKSKATITEEFKEAKSQAAWLSRSRIVFLNEVDYGMNRTQYKNIAKELGTALNMHAVFAPEFIELGPLYLRNKQLHPDAELKALQAAAKANASAQAQQKKSTVAKSSNKKVASKPPTRKDLNPELQAFAQAGKIQTEQYKGLHGSAILTDYPILQTETIRLPNVYDWYAQERLKISKLESVKRKAADMIFLEDILTEQRLGSRMALIVDIAVPEVPEGKVTLVSVHLENRAPAKARQKQMDYLLSRIKDRRNPVIIGGDWNTTRSDVSPTSVKKEVRHYATSPSFWARRAINFVPFGVFIGMGINAGDITKNLFDPAAPNIPLISPNEERQLFVNMKNFRFDDGTAFDTRGEKEYTYNQSTGFMANSNQRWFKGFVPTFSFERPLLKFIGRYKLDWFIVKDYVTPPLPKSTQLSEEASESPEIDLDKTEPIRNQSYLFAPVNARTLSGLDHLFGVKLSDHAPITIDLLLADPTGKLPKPVVQLPSNQPQTQLSEPKSDFLTNKKQSRKRPKKQPASTNWSPLDDMPDYYGHNLFYF